LLHAEADNARQWLSDPDPDRQAIDSFEHSDVIVGWLARWLL